MTTLAWPAITRSGPRDFELTLEANTQTFSSPLSRAVQTVEMPGARWRVSFTLQNLQEADTALLQAFMAQLRGRAGRFALHNFARPVPRGTASGTPLVKGASQTGTSLNIDSLAIGATLLAGDYIGINGELKIVVADATANGAGEMTVTFEPPLRSSPADNAAVTLASPTATFMLTDDAMRTITRPGRFSDISIDAVEVWS
jgi:hypothetical protein